MAKTLTLESVYTAADKAVSVAEAQLVRRIKSELYQLAEELAQIVKTAAVADATYRPWRSQRMDGMMPLLSAAIAARYAALEAATYHEYEAIARIEQDAFTQATSGAQGYGIVSAAAVRDTLVVGAPVAAWWAKLRGDLELSLGAKLRLSLMGQEDPRTMVKHTLRAGPAITSAIRNAVALGLTAVYAASNTVRFAIFGAHPTLVQGVQAVTVNDDRRSAICDSLSGGEWDLEGRPLPGSRSREVFPGPPPWHYRCRSSIRPILKMG